MHLSPDSPHQLDQPYLDALDEAALRVSSVKLLEDLKEVWDRLNQGPENSSRPPSRRAPWERKGGGREPEEDPEDGDREPEAAAYAAREGPPWSRPARWTVPRRLTPVGNLNGYTQMTREPTFLLSAVQRGFYRGRHSTNCGTSIVNPVVRVFSSCLRATGAFTNEQSHCKETRCETGA